MAYTGKPGDRRQLGIKPSEDDHKFVHTLSLMGVGVRQLCVALGERYGLERPMSRMTLYHHFRADIVRRRRGRIPSKATLKRRWEENMTSGMRSMIEEIQARRRKKHGEEKGR